ncbi:MAG TPA: DUF3047 domain-containing protein [Methylomirabilota bacterium]
MLALLLLAAGALVMSLAGSPRRGAVPGAPMARGGGVALAAVRAPGSDAQGRVRVPVTDRLPARLPSSGVPAGWEVAAFAGEASIELVRNEGRVAVRLRSEGTSFALHRDVVVDVREYPILTWSWKMTRLPAGGDVRDSARDDQAAQVYVVFPRWPSPRTNSDVIGYVWDTRAPAGTTLTHPRAPNVRIVVLQSGGRRRDTWLREQRNLAEDYRALFGGQPPRVGKVALMIDSNDTRGAAEALFGDLAFTRPGSAQHTDIPIAMLR